MPERRTATRQRRSTRNEPEAAPQREDEREDEDEDVEDRSRTRRRAEGGDADARAEDRNAGARTSRRSGKRAGSGRISAREAAEAGKEGLLELLKGKSAEGVTSVEPDEDGWLIGVEILEDHRVPSTSDLLSLYEVDLDAGGALLSYRRVKRYSRGRGDSDGDV